MWESRKTDKQASFEVEKGFCRTALLMKRKRLLFQRTEARVGQWGHTCEGEQEEQRQLRPEELLNRIKLSSDDVIYNVCLMSKVVHVKKLEKWREECCLSLFAKKKKRRRKTRKTRKTRSTECGKSNKCAANERKEDMWNCFAWLQCTVKRRIKNCLIIF